MIPTNIDAKTRELIAALSFDAPAAESALADWFRMFPESFYRVAGAGLARKADLSVQRLMASDEQCCSHLCDPALLDARTAIKLARSLLRLEPRLDVLLAHAAIEWASLASDQKPLRRCLEILEGMASGARINSALVQLLGCRNPAVRSKVVDLLVRSSTNEVKVREWLRDPDPRIRANVLEALAEFGGELSWIRQVLLDGLNDPHARAAANAAIGLYRMGAQEPAIAKLSEMASSEDPLVRCSAAWAMGQVPNVKLFEVLSRLRTDPAPTVRWQTLKSLSSFNRAGVKPKQVAPFEEPAAERAEEQLATPAQAPPPPEPARPAFNTRTFGRLM